MALALVKLRKYRGDDVYEFLDYVSEEVAKLGVQIQGSEHWPNEYDVPRIVKIYRSKESNAKTINFKTTNFGCT